MVFCDLDQSQCSPVLPCNMLVCKQSLLLLAHEWYHVNLLVGRALAINLLMRYTKHIAIDAASISRNMLAVQGSILDDSEIASAVAEVELLLSFISRAFSCFAWR